MEVTRGNLNQLQWIEVDNELDAVLKVTIPHTSCLS